MTYKDLFSQQGSDYSRYRPSYPSGLFTWLARDLPNHDLAVDIGAGSGQATAGLAAHFGKVIAIEPSQGQLAHARTSLPNVEYRVGGAEATGLNSASADLMVAAQAFHWFDQARFFGEVRRVVRARGRLAVWCYGLSQITPEVDAVVHDLYEGYLGPFWEPERRMVENGYRDVVFPFQEIAVPPFDMQTRWSLLHLVGFLGTWSPLKPYIKARGENPLELLLPRLESAWSDAGERVVSWPLAVRVFTT
jgi:SAM-dependent methyltransferase